MIYRKEISTPANTDKYNKVQTKIRLRKGVIHKVEFDFPEGNEGVLHTSIRHGNRTIWPSNDPDGFATENRLISFSEYYELKTAPYELTAETWNESLNNEHRVVIRLGLLKREHVLRRTI